MSNYPTEKYLIMRDRPHTLSPVYWNAISQTSFITRRIHGIDVIKEWNIYKNGRMQSIFIKNNWDKAADIISKKLLKNKKYFSTLQEKLNRTGKRINLFFKDIKKKNISKLRFNELVNLARKIKELWLDYDMVNVPPWYIGGDKFKERIQNLLKLSHEDFLFLTTPSEKTGVSRLEYDLLKYTKLVKEGKKTIETAAENLSEKYGWIPFGYDGPEYWDKNYFFGELKEKIKTLINKINKEIWFIEQKDKGNFKKKKEIIKKHKLNKKQLELINRINALAVWTDERKNLQFKLHYYYSQVLLELGKRYNISYKNLKFLFTDELHKLGVNRDKMIKISKYRIKNEFILEFKNGKYYPPSDKKKNKILRELETQAKGLDIIDIKGIVASRGEKNIYQGIAKILLSPGEGYKVKKEDFLVTTMTTPDYIVSMRRAAAIITDEGGVTCHAAIISRELNKPCIIGTKIATQVLKDGDLVEVDANKGVVKIIKKAGQQ